MDWKPFSTTTYYGQGRLYGAMVETRRLEISLPPLPVGITSFMSAGFFLNSMMNFFERVRQLENEWLEKGIKVVSRSTHKNDCLIWTEGDCNCGATIFCDSAEVE